jgi:hypothetical protein
MKTLKRIRLVFVSLALVLMTFAVNPAARVKLAKMAQRASQVKESTYCRCHKVGTEYWLCCQGPETGGELECDQVAPSDCN